MSATKMDTSEKTLTLLVTNKDIVTDSEDPITDQAEQKSKFKRFNKRFRVAIYPILGLLFTAASAVLFSLTNCIVKWLKDVDPFTIAFYRFFFLFILASPGVIHAWISRRESPFPSGLRLILLARSLTGSLNLVVHFYALKHLPIADTNLIAATAPIFTVISARVFLKEAIIWLDIANIVLVLVGLALIVKPPFIFGNYEDYAHDPELVIALVLLILSSAVLQANVYVILRFLKDVSVGLILFNFGWMGSIVAGLCSIIFGCRCFPNAAYEWSLLVATGVISFIAQIFLTASAKFDSAAKISLYRKAFDIMVAFMFQLLFFDDIPDTLKIIGATIITVAILSSGIKKLWPKKETKCEENLNKLI